MLTLRNPAQITREISERAARQAGYHFRITSLKPINPGNAADDFKSVNDTDGHSVGDLVLRTIAESVQANTRAYDIIARYGGEDFLVVLPGVDATTALAACERIHESIAQATAAGKNRCLVYTVRQQDDSVLQGKPEVPATRAIIPLLPCAPHPQRKYALHAAFLSQGSGISVSLFELWLSWSCHSVGPAVPEKPFLLQKDSVSSSFSLTFHCLPWR